MGGSRILPLFDPSAQPSSWNERMREGEYAVHDSHHEDVPFCTVFASLPEAESFAHQRILETPELRCRIYDHHGLIGKPLREFKGASYKGDSDLSPRLRRWVGSILFFGGIALILFDWFYGFRPQWPSILGTRMLVPGATLLVTEIILLFYTRHERAKHTADTHNKTQEQHG